MKAPKVQNFLFFLYLFFIRFGHASGVDCQEILAAFVGEMHKPLVDPKVSYQEPTSFLKEIFESKGTHYSESAIKAFEDDVQELFPPPKSGESKKWEELGRKWKLNEEQLATVRSYYSFFVFDGAEEMVGKKKDLFAHVKKLTLEYHLEKNPKLKARYDYYQKNLGEKSVPEMAKELGMSQGQVYKELQFYNLSIVEVFGGEYGEGESQASRFVRHYLNQENRGVSWGRVLEGEREDALLVQLHEQGLSHAEMAEVLNKLAGVTDSKDTSIRTEASVAAKVKALGLSELNPHKMKDLSIDPYGIVKISGALVPGPATEFLFDNRKKGFVWCSKELGVTPQGLYRFLERQHIEGIFERKKSGELAERARVRGVRKAKSAVEGQENAEVGKEKEQSEAMGTLIEWIRNNNGKVPGSTDWTEATGVNNHKFFGLGDYSPTSEKKQKEHRFFDSVDEGWGAIRKKVVEEFADADPMKQEVLAEIAERIKASQQQLKAAEDNKKSKEVQQGEAIDKLIERVKNNNGELPNNQNWARATGVGYRKFFGLGDYSPTSEKKQKEHRLFDSVKQGWEAIRKKVEAEFEDADPMKQEVLDEIAERIKASQRVLKAAEDNDKRTKEERQSEAMGTLIEWIRNNNGKVPGSTDWTEAIVISYEKFFGVGDYSPKTGKKEKKHHLFDSVDEGWGAIRKKVEAEFEDADPMKQKVLDEIAERIKHSQQKLKAAEDNDKKSKEERRSEAIGKLIEWVRKNEGDIPNQSKWTEATGVNHSKFFGKGFYSPKTGKKEKKHHLFDSVEQGWGAIRKKVEAEFEDADPIKQKVLDEIAERIKHIQQILKAAEKRKQTPQVEGGQDASP